MLPVVKKIIDFVMDILETVTFVGSLFIVVYLFILSPHQVKGSSMVPTFENGDYILTSRIAYKFGKPQRGDVVVFKSPKNPDVDFIKRVIGSPGDRVMVQSGQVAVNGLDLMEGYLAGMTETFPGGFLQEGVEVVVPEGHLFLMGDNRPRSSDSREFGFIETRDIIGKVFYRYFPLDKMGKVENPYVTTSQKVGWQAWLGDWSSFSDHPSSRS